MASADSVRLNELGGERDGPYQAQGESTVRWPLPPPLRENEVGEKRS